MSTLSEEDRRDVWNAYLQRGEVQALILLRRKTGVGLREAAEVLGSLVNEHQGALPPRDLLDRAAQFMMAGDSSWLTGAQVDLNGGAGRWSRAEQEEALRRARLLYDRAMDLCGECHAKKRGFKSILTELRSACPGFSEEVYEKMWGLGMVYMR